jgi:hypothetical protein
MNVRKVNLTLWTLTAGLSAAAIVCAALGVLAPVEVPDPGSTHSRRGMAAATSQASPDARLDPAAFERIAALRLRKPLDGTGAVPTTAAQMTQQNATPAAAGAPFALVGTIGQSLAMIQTTGGVIEIKAVGEQANGAKILAIRPSQVDVEVAGGARITIAKPREPGGG